MVDALALRPCVAAVSIQVDTDFFVSRYGLPKVGVLLQPCWGLGHAIAAPGAQLQQSSTSVAIQHMCKKASKATKDLDPSRN
jgi:hypothetical protein